MTASGTRFTWPTSYDGSLGVLVRLLQRGRRSDGSYPWLLCNLANILSLSRIFIVPLSGWLAWTAWHEHTRASAILLIVIALLFATDIVDGTVARATFSVSEWGKAIDPIVDKLAEVAAIACWLTLSLHRYPHAITNGILGGLLIVRALEEALIALYARRELRDGLRPQAELVGKYKFHLDLLALLLGVIAGIYGGRVFLQLSVLPLIGAVALGLGTIERHRNSDYAR